jgi:hypothetical protein
MRREISRSKCRLGSKVESSIDQWREPQDEYGHALQAAFDTVLASPDNPHCLAPFEPILYDLYLRFDQHRVDRLGWMGWELDEALTAGDRRVTADVARFCEHLPELLFGPNAYNADVCDMLIWVREILASPLTPHS